MIIQVILYINYLFRASLSRTRRPDRAVYVPRAKRSQTLPPSSSSSVSSKSHHKKSEKSKSKSIDENQLPTLNSDDCQSTNEPVITSCDRLGFDSDSQTKNWQQNSSNLVVEQAAFVTSDKNLKNLNNTSTMSDQQTKSLTIESAGGISNSTDKEDGDEKELIKASQEMNRSNRKLIKQTFKSDVLEIEMACEAEDQPNGNDDANKEEDDWDSL